MTRWSFAGLLLAAAPAFAVPLTIAHHGRLLSGEDTPLDGAHDITVRIYPPAVTGQQSVALWEETYTASLSKGVYSILIGDTLTGKTHKALDPSVFEGDEDRFLAIKVDGDAEMTPWLPIGSTVYALRAGDAEALGGEAPAFYASQADLAAQTAALNDYKTEVGTTYFKKAGGAVSGDLTVTGAASVGALTATSGAFSGALSAGATTLSSATVSGALGAGAATLGSASVTGTLDAGATTLASAAVTGGLSAGSAGVTGALTAGSGAFTGAASAGSLAVGTGVLAATSGGNVGVGNAAPTRKFEVTEGGNMVFSAGATNGVQVLGPANLWIGYNASDLGFVNNRAIKALAGTDLHLQTNDTDRITVKDATGNVGIGTATPAAALQVNGNHASQPVAVFKQTHASNGGRIAVDGPTDDAGRPSSIQFLRGGNLKWNAGGVYTSDVFGIGTTDLVADQKLVVTTAGNVGIGTVSPGAKLEVAGDAKITGGLKADFDSGWFAVSSTAANTYTLTHNLGVFPTRLVIFASNSSSPTWVRPMNLNSGGNTYSSPETVFLSTTEAKLTTCCSDWVIYCDSNNPCPTGLTSSTSGYLRVLMWK